jgi:ribosomal protein S18 acetylase RimI-like enzyme
LSASDNFPQKFVLSYFEGDKIIGTAAFLREDSAKERHRGWIWSVYVRPEGRGRKIGRQLMERLIDEARRTDGLEILTLIVSINQTEARTLYTSLGFFTAGFGLRAYKLPDSRHIGDEEMTFRF